MVKLSNFQRPATSNQQAATPHVGGCGQRLVSVMMHLPASIIPQLGSLLVPSPIGPDAVRASHSTSFAIGSAEALIANVRPGTRHGKLEIEIEGK